jgi:DNA repair protein RadC
MKATNRRAVLEQIAIYGNEDRVIGAAMQILRNRMGNRCALGSPADVRSYLALNLQQLEREVFWCVWLDAQNRVMAAEESFRGTLTQTSVYPREIVKSALHHNAAAVIFAHNHPSGLAEPSHADEAITRVLKQALAMVDVKVLDHFIIGEGVSMSFAERGLI